MAAKKRELEDELKAMSVEIANLRCQVEMLAEAVQDRRFDTLSRCCRKVGCCDEDKAQ